MQVACPSCSAEYPVDERRLPATGLKMRCPKCGSRFHVHPDGRIDESGSSAKPAGIPKGFPKPGGVPRPGSVPKPVSIPRPQDGNTPLGLFGGTDAGLDLDDLPAPKKASAPPSFSELDLDLPKAKSAKPRPMAITPRVMELDLPAKTPVPPAKPLAGTGHLDDLDLDLPAPKAPAAPKRPIAPPVEEDDFELDLPAPKAPSFDGALGPPMDDDPPLVGGFDLDLPAPRGARPFDHDLDLPAPRGAVAAHPGPPHAGAVPRSALANEGTPFDDLDLPAARSAHDLPRLRAFDDADLPQPKTRSVIEQADEAFGDLDLPMPKSAAQAAKGFDDLDLPTPKVGGGGFDDLDLPTPQRTPPGGGGFGVGFGDLDLPTPREVTDLPAPAGISDLPTASVGADLPATVGSADLPVAKGFGNDLELPNSQAAPASGNRAAGGVGYGELDLGGGIDVGQVELAPESDDMEFADIPQESGEVRGDSMPPPRVAATNKREARAEKAPRKSRAAWVALVVLVVLLGGGAALGLTSFGMFGINLLEPMLPGAGDPVRVRAAIAQAEEESASDRWVDVRTSLVTLGTARHDAGLNRELLARSLLHEALFRVRFGDRASATRASAIRARMQERGMEGPEFALALAGDALAQGQNETARRTIGPALAAASTDPYVNLVVGEIELADGELEAAVEAFTASAAAGGGARALWGVARARMRGDDPAAARAAIDAVLEVSPNHGAALVARAEILHAAHEDDAALAIAERAAGATDEALRSSPLAEARAWTLIGEIQEQRGRTTQATTAYERALAAIDAHIPALLGAGRVLLRAQPSDALPRFESVLQAEGADALTLPSGRNARQEATLGAARAMMVLDRVQEANTNLAALLAEREEDGEVALWLGKTEEMLDPPDRDAAEQHYRAAIQVAPRMFAAYLALAELFLATDRGSDAGAVLEQAVSRVDETAEMRWQLGTFELHRNRFAEAIRELELALRIDPELPGALFSLGVAQRRSGNLDAATAAFDRLAAFDASYVGLSLERGLLYEARGESDRAVQAYEAALQANPDDMDLLLRLGAAQVEAGRIDGAQATLERVRNARPNSAEANYFVGRVTFARGQYAESLAHFRRAIQLDPTRGEFHFYVGWAAFQNQQLAEALRGVDDAIERDPSLGDAYWIRGAIKLRSGRPEQALEDLRRALQLRPSRYAIYATMGEAYDQTRQTNQTIEAYRQAVAHVDDNGLWFYRLGRHLLDRGAAGDRAEASAALQRATLLGDAETPLPVWLADAHRLRGEVLRPARECIPHYRRYLELAPDSSIDRGDVRRILMDLGAAPPD